MTTSAAVGTFIRVISNPFIFLLGAIFSIENFIGIVLFIFKFDEMTKSFGFIIFMMQAAGSLIIWLIFTISETKFMLLWEPSYRQKIYNKGMDNTNLYV